MISLRGRPAYSTSRSKLVPIPIDEYMKRDQILEVPHPDDRTTRELDGISRRALGALGALALALPAGTALGPLFSSQPNDRAIPSTSGRSVEEAQLLAMDIAGTVSTLYSQVSSTLRMEAAGYMDAILFEQTCRRRLGSPYIEESLRSLQDVMPVLGATLAYGRAAQPGLAGMFASAHPPQKEYESLTLEGLQRSRRMQYLLKSMDASAYTPTCIGLLLKDLKRVVVILDTMLEQVALL